MSRVNWMKVLQTAFLGGFGLSIGACLALVVIISWLL